MSEPSTHPDSASSLADQADQYVVIARRYRPQVFEDLIGQEHVATALSNAISTNRVGHAYLFTGARGVGKTSAARILAKALNCRTGPVPVPCNECDDCERISTGDDIDVLEIDGASNRGIEEIRQLRKNAGIRPSRSRYKIYIIDEVHMLTREAFNALLKTLEEPPEHVKFIFCTTEPTKIPVTILSRCQRFDFAGILWKAIAQRLCLIVESEKVAAEPEALQVLARRAAGSMRDAQSLLEQLLAFSGKRITVADVHSMLGSAGDERLETLVAHLVDHDAAAALADLDSAVHEGIDLGQLIEQLFGYFRDCMTTAVGCAAESLLYASPNRFEAVTEVGQRLGIDTLLAAMQILDQTLSRLRYSTHGRILTELAIVRICHLEEMAELPTLIAQLQGSAPSNPPVSAPTSRSSRTTSTPSVPKPRKKKLENEPEAEKIDPETEGIDPKPAPLSGSETPLTEGNATEIWSQALAKLPGMAAEQAKQFERVAISGPNRLVVWFKPGYTLAKSFCERPEQLAKFQQALVEVTGAPVRVDFALSESSESSESTVSEAASEPISPQQRLLEMSRHPLIERVGELFGAHPTRVEVPPDIGPKS